MKRSTESREIIETTVAGVCLRGTYHRPLVTGVRLISGARVGILFPNSGVMPRAATGDSFVYWADSLAALGYPSFRFDLEGLGDSGGFAPARIPDFVARANAGDYAPQVSAIADDIVDRFDVSEIVLLAHCSGTVSALYAGASSQHVKGVVLMDPYFHLQEMNHQRGQCAGTTGLPDNANVALIGCWNQLASAGIPILVLTAPSFRAKGGGFDYVKYLQSASRQGNISVQAIEGTPHSFAEGPGKAEVRKSIELWLRHWFPLTSGSNRAPSAAELNLLAER